MMKYLVVISAVAVLCCTASLVAQNGTLFPPGSPESGGVYNMVLTYLDGRSLTGPGQRGYDPWMHFNSTMYEMLISHPTATIADSAAGATAASSVPYFDAVLLIGYRWSATKCFWPGECPVPLDFNDTLSIWDLWRTMGAEQLNEANARVKATTNPSIEPTKLYVTIPYPDTRQQHFCVDCGPGGKALNMSIDVDRVEAVKLWVTMVTNYFEAQQKGGNLTHVQLTGFYWFLEDASPRDTALLQDASKFIHSIQRFDSHGVPRFNQSFRFTWIPYYDAAVHVAPNWRMYGFDWITIQPNFAFNPVEPSVRFPEMNSLMRKVTAGVEMELPLAVRNPDIHKNATESFYDYLAATNEFGWLCGAVKTYYYANSFVEMAALGLKNETMRGMGEALFQMVNATLHC